MTCISSAHTHAPPHTPHPPHTTPAQPPARTTPRNRCSAASPLMQTDLEVHQEPDVGEPAVVAVGGRVHDRHHGQATRQKGPQGTQQAQAPGPVCGRARCGGTRSRAYARGYARVARACPPHARPRCCVCAGAGRGHGKHKSPRRDKLTGEHCEPSEGE